ncbi:hypothetical protein [Streptomyces lunaelactis]|uniref:hypothetical protein n=1 Tax=Streptomyces lunaelactis TaxID=1535768 RepID=UPI001584B18B|nr:hypothetical protein [Streptomyces lunaelactis]NUL09064.1 hypothetical protein [Streptomyces lunaelactis]
MTTMNFILQGRDRLSDVMNRAGDSAIRLNRRLKDTEDHGAKAIEGLKKAALSLAPAIIPAAAAMAPLVASTAAAGVAVAAYGAALGPQIAAMSEASQAEKKYKDAVDESGVGSKEAVQAHEAYRQAMAKLPPETRRAAAGLSVLKDQYKGWSDGLAKDTMGPVVKGMAIFGGLLPKLTPLVKGTSTELNRMMTLLGGGMQSPGFDRLVKQFTEFSTGVLKRANDGIVSLTRSLDTGKVGGGLSEFMAYAKANGPLLGEVLRNIGTALMNVMKAGADVGVGMLQAVNALAKLVAAVPPGVITVLLQLAVAMKVARLAAIGMGATTAAMAAFGGQLVAMRTAAGASAGGLARFTAAFGAMSRGVRVAVAGTGIGLLLIAMSALSEMGKRAPADMDRMTTSLGKFAQTGKLSGEAARILGSDFKEFDAALRGMARPDQLLQIQQGITSFFGMDSTPVKEWKATLDDADKALANMVTSGNAKLAAQAFDLLSQRARSQGLTTAELNKELGDYRAALANQAFEQQLAAQAMGLFGTQAQATSAKLAAQKQSADGLRQAIQALNDVQRAGLGGMIGFEASIDAATKAAKENAGSLKMVHGQLNLNSEKSRTAASALNDLAAKTDEAAGAARDNGSSWSTVNGIYERGRKQLIANAMQMGLTRGQAKALADQILKTPNKTAMLKGNLSDLQSKLADAKKRLASVPDSRKAQVRAEIAQLEAQIRRAKAAVASVRGKSVSITTTYRVVGKPPGHAGPGGFPKYAQGGLVGFPAGGHVRGPGTGTSDSILAQLSDGEFVIPAKQVSTLGVGFFEAIRAGRLGRAAQAGRPASSKIPAARGGNGVTEISANINIHGAMDPVAVGREVRRVMLELKRTYGVNVSLGVG